MTLLDRLTAIQEALGQNDSRFAQTLGISHVLWLKTKRGDRKIRYEVLSGARAAFPDNEVLGQAILDYLALPTEQAVA